MRVGEIYGFPVSIASERVVKDGVEAIQNRFVVEGNYKYKYNNGYIAMSDTHAACMNFLNALERIPEIIRQHQERKAKAEKDVPTQQAIVSRTWGKEDELKDLKAQLVELDKKITATLAPKEENHPEVVTPNPPTTLKEDPDNPAQSTDSHKSMVAEPTEIYRPHIPANRPSFRSFGT